MTKPRNLENKATLDAQNGFNIQDTIGMVANNLKLQLSGKPMYIPCWAGGPGIGKTTHAKIIAKELGLDMLYFSMNKPLEAFTGLPITSTISFDDDIEKRNSAYVYWSKPELIHLANNIAEAVDQIAETANKVANKKKNNKYVNNGCLIFLDDIHIMSPDVQKCFFEFVLERKLGNHHLSPRCAIIAAMNSSSSAGFDGFLSPINARIERIDVTIDFRYWYNYCGAYLDPYTACFLRQGEGHRLTAKESTDEPFATPRSWCYMSEHMKFFVDDYHKTKDKITFLNRAYMLACGYVGKEVAGLLKDSIAQQIEYDFEGMVTQNRYSLNIDNVFDQLAFGNVVRYFRNEKDVDNFIKFINKLLTENEKFQTVENVILNIMFELLSHKNMYENRNDEEGIKKYKLYRYAQERMFRDGDPCVNEKGEKLNRIHLILNKLMRNKLTLEF